MKCLKFLFVGSAFVFGIGCETTPNPMSSAADGQAIRTALETPADIHAKMEYLQVKRNEQLCAIQEKRRKELPQPRRSGAVGRVLRVPQDFLLIQQAIDSAWSGDKIIVADGVYNEFIVVTREGVTITSEQPGGARLTGGFILYWVNDVEIAGFEIVGGGPDGAALEAIESRRSTLRNNIISGAFFGVYLFESPESIVQENNVHHNVIGIKVDLSDKALLKLNNVQANRLDAIQDFDSAETTYSNNQCLSNGRAGFYMEKSAYWSNRKRNTVVGNDNRFNDNTVAGIVLKGSKSNYLGDGNEADNNGLFGLLLVESSDSNLIAKWTALGNGIYDCYNATKNMGNVFKENAFGTCFNCNSRAPIISAQQL
jgi:parallel beta-helix repeat protein